MIQVAGSDNVLIENCRFEGQSFRGSGDKTRELLQIEPGTVKGYPYTLVQNKAPSTNVTMVARVMACRINSAWLMS